MASMDAMLLVATSFVAGVVAHAVWQTHRGVSEIRKSHDQHKGDNSSEHAELDLMLSIPPASAETPSRSISLPPSPALPPLLTPTSAPSASLSIPTDVPLTHPYPRPSPLDGGSGLNGGTPSPHVHTPGVLLTPPPEAWIAYPEGTITKAGATDTWGEAVDHIEGHEGEHI